MSIRREQAFNLVGELGEPVQEFNLKAHLSEEPTIVANRLRKALKIDIDVQRNWADEWQAWRQWRTAVEQVGVLVFQLF